MRIQVLYFEGCPNHLPAVELVRTVAADLGVDAEIAEAEVTDQADAQRLRFLGSPTIQVDDVDIEPSARDLTSFGMSCRTYNGAGMPPRELMVEALAPSVGEAQGGEHSGLWAVGGSIGSALLASACCWAPLLLLAVGTSAVGVSAAFEKTRPLFLMLAAVFLGTGFYLNYFRHRSAPACTSCAAPGRKLKRFNRATLWVSTLLVIAIALFPSYIGSLIGANTPSVTAQAAAGASTTTLNIAGMTCGGCAAVVHSALVNVPGVRGASVSYPNGLARIILDPVAPPTLETLRSAVEKVGYQATIEHDQETQ